jgi:dihydrodipicolinate synthase/N-acetylneuraminate lyase
MHTSTRTGTRLARHAESAGAAAVVSVPPYYSSPPEREVRTYFRDLAEAVEIPLVVYNNPAASGVSLSVPTLAKLAQERTVAAIKDSHGDPARIPSLRMLCPPDTAILYGEDYGASRRFWPGRMDGRQAWPTSCRVTPSSYGGWLAPVISQQHAVTGSACFRWST